MQSSLDRKEQGMIILGLSGNNSGSLLQDRSFENNWLTKSHDAAAALMVNGELVAALEEERPSRIKHYGKTPVNAIVQCLNSQNIKIDQVDRIVIHCRENEVDALLTDDYIFGKSRVKKGRDLVRDIVSELFDYDYPGEKVEFVEHHMCHAANAYYMSGFNSGLILTIDGASPEGYSGYIISAEGDSWKVLDRISNDHSLGSYYTRMIMLLGYFMHDEYKVMGLAPYGNPKRFRSLVKRMYTLLPEGKFTINNDYYGLFYDYIPVRRKGEPFLQEHKDLAAALQESLEIIAMHILEYYQKLTGHRRLCLSGGVAHNCSMNGKILYSGLFDEMFVQPAAHDAGNALGAAMYVAKKYKENLREIPHFFLGTDIGDEASVKNMLDKWKGFIDYSREEDIVEKTAQLLVDGSVIGWVQGRSEFGPRALGNRSILADPRPAENKTIINAMVKKREGYRPFAPSVMEEYLWDYYEVPPAKANLSFMNYVLQTKKDKKSILGAVTHVDGSARVQTVSKAANEKYWSLIDRFREKTGIPILLNTSFNNNVEPIVDTELDALTCFLTTKINYLVIGDYLIRKKEAAPEEYLSMVLKLPAGSCLEKGRKEGGVTYRIHIIESKSCDRIISEEVYKLLDQCDGKRSLGDLFELCRINEKEQQSKLIDELINLWSGRLICLICK